MVESEQYKKLIHEKIGFLFEEKLIEELYKVGKIKNILIDDVIIRTGDEVFYIPFILDGALKISREKSDGEELLLYYIESGDTCAMTLQCCVKKSNSEVKAKAMENSALLMVPIEYMSDWMERFASWRNYILESYHLRITELMETVDAIAFMRLDERLDMYLKDQAKLLGSLEINHTHLQIAEDLHSSRVVISRLLKQMEVKGMIELKRNKVVLKTY